MWLNQGKGEKGKEEIYNWGAEKERFLKDSEHSTRGTRTVFDKVAASEWLRDESGGGGAWRKKCGTTGRGSEGYEII